MLYLFLMPTTTQFWPYAVIPVFTAFNGLTMANMSSLVSRSAEMGRQGEAMGISSSVQSLAQVPASALVGYITADITSGTPLLVAGICIITGGALFVAAFRPKYVSSTVMGAGGPPAAAH